MNKKKRLVPVGEKDEEAETYLMAKVHVVEASLLNYLQFDPKKKKKIQNIPKRLEVQRKIQNSSENDKNVLSGQRAQRHSKASQWTESIKSTIKGLEIIKKAPP